MNNDAWSPLPANCELLLDQVHIWRAPIWPVEAYERAAPLLSTDEQDRALRFHFDRDRERYVAGRASLRTILGRYLGCPAAEVTFIYGPQGKPSLAERWSDWQLCFNSTHSHDLAMYAIARGRTVGIDVEHVRQIAEWRGIAGRYFTAAEAAHLAQAPSPSTEFLRLWTRKEAVIKAIGRGLSMPLDCFDLSTVPGDGRTAFTVDEPEVAGKAWTLHELSPDASYVGAVVVEGAGAKLSRFGFNLDDL